MAYADQQMSGSRVVAIIIVALIHIALGYALVTGLAYEAAQQLVERVTTVDVTEPPPPPPPPPDEPPPPQDVPQTVPPPMAPPPPINIAPAPPPIRTTTTITPPAPPVLRIPPAAVAGPPSPPAPPPPAPPAPSKARGVKPKGNLGAAMQRDYPRAAERQQIEGTVGLRLTIGADGRVSECSISKSSGSSVLDDGACQSIRRVGRFDPALDRDGNPISATWTTSIAYQLD